MLKKLMIAAGALFAFSAAGAANAVILDFTDDSNGLSGPSGLTGITYELTSDPDGFVQLSTDSVSGPFCGLLACDRDGVGVNSDDVNDDEISELIEGAETLIVSFSEDIFLDAFGLLDFFKADSQTFEVASISLWDDGIQVFSNTYNATAALGTAGFFVGTVGLIAFDEIQFTVIPPNNDTLGVGDYALAGLDIREVPIPGAALLLLSGLAGLGFAGRGKKRA